MFSFFGNETHTQQELAIVYDIGGGSIGAALVYLHREREHVPEILYTTRKEMSFEATQNPTQLISSMTEALRKVGENIQNEGMKQIDLQKELGTATIAGIYCIFSSPWHISQTQQVEEDYGGRRRVTQEEVDRLSELASERFEEGPIAKYSQDIDEELETLEEHIIQILVNGYDTTTPVGKHGRRLSLSVYFSVLPSEVFSRVHSVIANRFNTEHFHFNSFSLASFSVLRNTFSHVSIPDFLFVDVSGELTDVSLIRNNVLTQTASFPVGANKVIRGIAEQLQISPEEARSRLNALKAGHLHQDEKDSLAEAAQGVSKEWQSEFKSQALEQFDDVTLPNHIFFIAADATGSILKQIMDATTVSEHNLKNDTLESVMISERMFGPYRRYRKKHTRRDHFLSMETIFANHLSKESHKRPHQLQHLHNQ